MQGASRRLGLRLRVALSFAITFVAGAGAVFAMAWLAGSAIGVGDAPLSWRRGVAAIALIALAGVDLYALRQRRYCPLGWRRQTPRWLVYRHGAATVAAAWGLDAGSVVTTFRVTALTWGAMGLAFLALAPWWLGLAYGLGFVVPFLGLIFGHRSGRTAAAEEPIDPGLETLLGRRGRVQLASLVLLGAAGAVLLAEILI